VILKVKKVHPEAKLPSYAHSFDAGMDLYAAEEVLVEPGQVTRIRSGIAMEIPEGYVGLCWDKSGVSMNNRIKLLGGVIDAGYRGELLLGVINLGTEPYIVKKGDKVMQLLIQKVENVDILESDELGDSMRGEKGFGSTGK
jgi:dUTP pyrophosphatase